MRNFYGIHVSISLDSAPAELPRKERFFSSQFQTLRLSDHMKILLFLYHNFHSERLS